MSKYRLIQKVWCEYTDNPKYNEVIRYSRPVVQMRVLGIFWVTIAKFFYSDKEKAIDDATRLINLLIDSEQ